MHHGAQYEGKSQLGRRLERQGGEGGGHDFLLKRVCRGGGGGGARGWEGVCGEMWGGGGQNFFFGGRNSHQAKMSWIAELNFWGFLGPYALWSSSHESNAGNLWFVGSRSSAFWKLQRFRGSRKCCFTTCVFSSFLDGELHRKAMALHPMEWTTPNGQREKSCSCVFLNVLPLCSGREDGHATGARPYQIFW